MTQQGAGMQPSDFIGGEWRQLPSAGEMVIESRDPARPQQMVWRGAAQLPHVEHAVEAARRAFPAWSAASVEERAAALRTYAERAAAAVPQMAALITREVGKTLAEATAEAKLLGDKVAITLDPISMSRVAGYEVAVTATRKGRCVFRPFGVMAVVGPFNFPAHLPNGHIVPALLLGNTVVFKPSEKAPGVAQLLAQLLGTVLPPGVFNVVNGGAPIAGALTAHAEIDGILFTGSWPVGRAIMQANLDRPGRMLALEMGGNNPAVVLDDADMRMAVAECARSAFATTGQRCTCTRRVIVHDAIASEFIRRLAAAAQSVAVGPGDSADPIFMGPIISRHARESVLQFQARAKADGARVHLASAQVSPPAAPGGWFMSPGVLEVDRFERDRDEEVFGPLVQVARARDLDDAIVQANATNFGLAASIFTRDRGAYERFMRACRAGCINWNTGTAGASSKLPFGGLGRSGNLRPAAAFSADYCAAPISTLQETGAAVDVPIGMRVE